MHNGPTDWTSLLVLVIVGAIASGINAVAGGGSLISFPTLTGVNLGGFRFGIGIPMIEANATNSVGLWPGSLAGGFGFWNLLPKMSRYIKQLWLPTVLGSIAGAWLLITTNETVFKKVVPALLLLATLLLAFQPNIKAFAAKHKRQLSTPAVLVLQFLVSVYGGYFGAGMGIMMLAVFTIYMEGNIHEINAAKAWLGLIINFTCSLVFIWKGIVILWPAVALILGSLIGGYYAAKFSQRVEPEKLRVAIAAYGFVTVAYFTYTSWFR